MAKADALPFPFPCAVFAGCAVGSSDLDRARVTLVVVGTGAEARPTFFLAALVTTRGLLMVPEVLAMGGAASSALALALGSWEACERDGGASRPWVVLEILSCAARAEGGARVGAKGFHEDSGVGVRWVLEGPAWSA